MTSVARVATTVISIHALLAESDSKPRRLKSRRCVFLSTLSLRRATRAENHASSQQEFLSTLSLRRATAHYDNYNLHCAISIHALLAESDHQSRAVSHQTAHFYPRSPCGERPKSDTATAFPLSFLSTLSLRRATLRLMFWPFRPC